MGKWVYLSTGQLPVVIYAPWQTPRWASITNSHILARGAGRKVNGFSNQEKLNIQTKHFLVSLRSDEGSFSWIFVFNFQPAVKLIQRRKLAFLEVDKPEFLTFFWPANAFKNCMTHRNSAAEAFSCECVPMLGKDLFALFLSIAQLLPVTKLVILRALQCSQI